jgi:mono/diheme cytochrome c family protein
LSKGGIKAPLRQRGVRKDFEDNVVLVLRPLITIPGEKEVNVMKIAKIAMVSLIVFGLFAVAFAAGDAAKGKALFNDPKFAGGSKACSACHADAGKLAGAADKKEFMIMGKTQKSLEEAINACIVGANKGKAIDVKSQQMQDMVAYIKSLKAPAKAPAKKSSGY